MTNKEFDSTRDFIKDIYNHAERIHDGVRYFTTDSEVEYFAEEMGGYIEVLKLLNGEIWERKAQENGEWSEPKCISHQLNCENNLLNLENDFDRLWIAIVALMINNWDIWKNRD